MDRLRLGGVPGVTPAKWLRVWAERVPGVPATLVALASADAAAALREQRVDAALVRLPIDDEGLHVVPLYEELPVVVAAKGHPIVAFETVTEADLAGEPMLEQGTMTEEELLQVVASGAGLAIVPMAVARALGGTETRHRVVTDLPPTSIALAWLRSADSPLHQELVGIVRGRRAGSSRGDLEPSARGERDHRAPAGQRVTGAKPRPSKSKPTPHPNRPRRRGGPGGRR